MLQQADPINPPKLSLTQHFMSPYLTSFGRTTLGLLCGVLLLVILMAGSAIWFSYQSERHNEEVKIEREVLIAANSILVTLLNAETSQRGYLITGDREFLASYEEARKLMQGEFETLRRIVDKRPSLKFDFAEIEAIAARKTAELQETVELKARGQDPRTVEIIRSRRGADAMGQLRAKLDGIIEGARVAGEGAQAALDVARRNLRILTIGGGILMVLFAAAASYVVAANTQALMEARQKVEELNEGLEERVAERTLELTRANDEIQRFAYIVSHDLRAPLVNVMGFTSELEAGTNVLREYFTAAVPAEEARDAAKLAATEDLPEAVQFIRSSTTRMDGLINTILKLSREGRRELAQERVDITALLQNAARSLQHQIDSKGATVEIDEELPSVVSDRLALEQVFGNLLDNAIKYLAKNRPGLIQVTGEQSGGRVKITVSDNGRGIAEQDRERIFELFRRAGAQDTAGEGVGLAHVRALVRRLGGDVTVTSQLGSGSAFTVELPKKAKFQQKGARS
jgi:signal transduction histidine kinase